MTLQFRNMLGAVITMLALSLVQANAAQGPISPNTPTDQRFGIDIACGGDVKQCKADIDLLAGMGIRWTRFGMNWGNLMDRNNRVKSDAQAQFVEILQYARSKGINIFFFVSDETAPAENFYGHDRKVRTGPGGLKYAVCDNGQAVIDPPAIGKSGDQKAGGVAIIRKDYCDDAFSVFARAAVQMAAPYTSDIGLFNEVNNGKGYTVDIAGGGPPSYGLSGRDYLIQRMKQLQSIFHDVVHESSTTAHPLRAFTSAIAYPRTAVLKQNVGNSKKGHIPATDFLAAMTVPGPKLSSPIPGTNMGRPVEANTLAADVDAFSIHTYYKLPQLDQAVESFVNYIPTLPGAGGKPIWITEGGHVAARLWGSEDDQIETIKKYCSFIRQGKIDHMFWWVLRSRFTDVLSRKYLQNTRFELYGTDPVTSEATPSRPKVIAYIRDMMKNKTCIRE